MYYSYPPVQPVYQPQPMPGFHHDPQWIQQDFFSQPPGADGSRCSSVQPMQRFLHDRERPFFPASAIDRDTTMHPLPDVPRRHSSFVPFEPTHIQPPRYLSPTNSALSSSMLSGSLSDREQTPWASSPSVQPAIYSPPQLYHEGGAYSTGGYTMSIEPEVQPAGQCISMHDVQQYPDAQPEVLPIEEEPAYTPAAYGSYAQEGYHPMEEESPEPAPVLPSQPYEPETPESLDVDVKPNIRTRRPSNKRTVTSPRLSKVVKRPAARKRSQSYAGKAHDHDDDDDDDDDEEANTTPIRAFPCPFTPYGCSSTFGSKNEWKRHVQTQHMRLGFWRCTQCDGGERKPNDFNRKDLFIQHVRRMHPIPLDGKKTSPMSKPMRRGSDEDDRALRQIAERSYRKTRSPPSTCGCLFCEQTFNSWDERMEHIGRHMEAHKKEEGPISPDAWHKDTSTEEWLQKEGLVRKQHGHLRLTQ